MKLKFSLSPLTGILALIFFVGMFSHSVFAETEADMTAAGHTSASQQTAPASPSISSPPPSLQQSPSPPPSLLGDVPGPAAFLGVLLKKLTIASTASDLRVVELLDAVPNMIPELYTVLTEL